MVHSRLRDGLLLPLAPPRPTCPAPNLCPDARQRPDGLFDLSGVFNTLAVRYFPLRLRLCVHYVLLDGQGQYSMAVGAAADADETRSGPCRTPSSCATRTTSWRTSSRWTCS